jgi:hypothetical protein
MTTGRATADGEFEETWPTIRSGPPPALVHELEELVATLVPTSSGVRHRFERILGRGAVYVTFRATRIDDRGAIPCVTKVVRPSVARALSPERPRPIAPASAAILAGLAAQVPPSPHVVHLLEYGTLAEDPAHGVDLPLPWLSYELIEADDAESLPRGPALFDLVRTKVADTGVGLDAQTAWAVVTGVARGLEWIHRHGLSHGALGPKEVFVVGSRDRAIAKLGGVALARTAEALRPPAAPVEGSSSTGDLRDFAALTRFALTGIAPRGAPDRAALSDAVSLDPIATATAEGRAALVELDGALASIGAAEGSETVDERSFADALRRVEAPLALLAAHARQRRPRRASAPPSGPRRASPWFWTERVRSGAWAASARIASIAIDADGRALTRVVDRGASFVAHFDGRAFRAVELPGIEVERVAAVDRGRFLVCGRDAGGAVVLEYAFDGITVRGRGRPAGRCVDACIVDQTVVFLETGRAGLALVVGDARLPLDAPRAKILLLRSGPAHTVLVAGDAAKGGTFLSAVDLSDLSIGQLWPQPSPGIGRVLDAVSSEESAWLAGPAGELVQVSRADATGRPRLRARRISTTAAGDIRIVALGPHGLPWCATDDAILRAAGDDTGLRAVGGSLGLAAPIVGLLPRAHTALAFAADGTVLEGRPLST